jgi:hypothetical protein
MINCKYVSATRWKRNVFCVRCRKSHFKYSHVQHISGKKVTNLKYRKKSREHAAETLCSASVSKFLLNIILSCTIVSIQREDFLDQMNIN